MCAPQNAHIDQYEHFRISIVTLCYDILIQWDLVCDQTVQANNIAGIYMLGRILGCLVVGPVADM